MPGPYEQLADPNVLADAGQQAQSPEFWRALFQSQSAPTQLDVKRALPPTATPLPPPDPRRFMQQVFEPPVGPEGYPSSEDAAFARSVGADYGKPYEAYSRGERFRNAPAMEGNLSVNAADSVAPYIFATPETDVPPNMKNDVADVYQRAALAANRSPISALGYDPSKFAMEFGNRETNLGGFYQPKNDEGWANAHYFETLVHESTHRGLQELKNSDLLSPEARKFLDTRDNDELVVRHLMQKYAGVKVPTEAEDKTASGKLERNADWSAKYGRDYSDPRPFRDVPWTKRIEEIEQAAIKLNARKRPGGPR